MPCSRFRWQIIRRVSARNIVFPNILVLYQGEITDRFDVERPALGVAVLLRDKKATELPDSYRADKLRTKMFNPSGFKMLLNFARCNIRIAEGKCKTLQEDLIQMDAGIATKQSCIRHQLCVCEACSPKTRTSVTELQAKRDNRLGRAEYLVQQAEQLCSTLYWLLEDTGCEDEARSFEKHTLRALRHCRQIVDSAAAIRQSLRRCR